MADPKLYWFEDEDGNRILALPHPNYDLDEEIEDLDALLMQMGYAQNPDGSWSKPDPTDPTHPDEP